MRLFRSAKHGAHWFAFGPKIGWVIFPAEVGGWQERQPAGRRDKMELREVPLRLGFNTGIPGAPMLVKPVKYKVAAATGEGGGFTAPCNPDPHSNALRGAAVVCSTAPEAL